MPTPATQRLIAWSLRQPDLRAPSADELRLIDEASAAGAVFPNGLWRDYFSGSSPRFPMQFEGAYAGLMADNPGVVEACDAAAARRDGFLRRLMPGGDLYPLVLAIEAANATAPLGRSSVAAGRRAA